MKEKPILFSTPMVRAIVTGRKTQTRRIVKPQPPVEDLPDGFSWQRDARSREYGLFSIDGSLKRLGYTCGKPRYYPGDVLYVRETWAKVDKRIVYAADGAAVLRWRPSIHMPRQLARIFLRVTAVRVERVNEISYEDAVAEGWDLATKQHPIEWYRALWDSLNANRGFRWTDAPWVWVYEFERCEAQRGAA